MKNIYKRLKIIPSEQREKYLHTIFIWGIILKGINGLVEMVGSVAFLFGNQLLAWIHILAQQEIIEDPTDIVANYIQHHFTVIKLSSETFGFLYLLSHGIIKLLLAIGLLRNKLWAYPTAILVFVFFIIYQLYRYSFTHSLFLILLTLFDIIIIWLTWHEYRFYKKQKVLTH